MTALHLLYAALGVLATALALVRRLPAVVAASGALRVPRATRSSWAGSGPSG